MNWNLVFALALTLSVTGGCADGHSDCHQSKDADRSIRGCTQIIEHGTRESQETKSIAFYSRGNAYADKGEHDRAIADYDKAIALNPKYSVAYNNRALLTVTRARLTAPLLITARRLRLTPPTQPPKTTSSGWA